MDFVLTVEHPRETFEQQINKNTNFKVEYHHNQAKNKSPSWIHSMLSTI